MKFLVRVCEIYSIAKLITKNSCRTRNKYLFYCTHFLRFPFDWRNPIGYLVALTLQYTANVRFFKLVACLVATGLGAFSFELSMTTHVKTDLKLINESAKMKENRLSTLKRLSEFIEFHSRLKELSILTNYMTVF